MLNGHGNDIFKYPGKIKYDFSSNVLHGFVSDLIRDVIASNIQTVASYPEPDAESLKCNIARFHHCPPQGVMVTNGSTEAFYFLAQLFAGCRSSIFTPSFAEYEDACLAYGHDVSFVSNQDIHPKQIFDSDMVWLGNPNNPDGKVVDCEVIKSWCECNPGTVLVVDEAYAQCCRGFHSARLLLDTCPNLILVQSLTKSFSIPGIRLGYILGNASLVQKIVKIPWRINSLALAVGNYIVENHEALTTFIEPIISTSLQLQKQLEAIDELTIYPSACNFFLARLHRGTALSLKEYLVSQHGILIRDAGNFRGLDKHFFRLATQSEHANNECINSIKQWISQV